jgi:aldehyde:ferredoxin oxidoreductase
MLSPQAIEKYREIYKAEFGMDLTFEDASEQAQRFLNLARIVMQPMPKRMLPRYNEILKDQKERSTPPSAHA